MRFPCLPFVSLVVRHMPQRRLLRATAIYIIAILSSTPGERRVLELRLIGGRGGARCTCVRQHSLQAAGLLQTSLNEALQEPPHRRRPVLLFDGVRQKFHEHSELTSWRLSLRHRACDIRNAPWRRSLPRIARTAPSSSKREKIKDLPSNFPHNDNACITGSQHGSCPK